MVAPPKSRYASGSQARTWLLDPSIDTLTTACGPHNRMVGPKPGQYTTSVLTDGPDAGRTAWRLNTEDGMPPNEARINRVNDIGPQIVAYLKVIRVQREHHQHPGPRRPPR